MGFFDAGGRAAKLANVGDSVTGRVLSWREAQVTKYGTDELDFWNDGTPKMQAIIQLEVDARDDDDDNGVRSLYVASTRQKRALIDALRKGGSKVPDEGGTLTMTYTGDDPKSANPRQPAKMYSASWSKPEQPSQVFGQTPSHQSQEPAQATSAPGGGQQTVAPAPDPWQAQGVSREDANKVRQLRGMGLNAQMIGAALGGKLTPEQVASVQ